MIDSLRAIRLKRCPQRRHVACVGFGKCERLQPSQRGTSAARTHDREDIVAVVQQAAHKIGSDESSGPSDSNSHVLFHVRHQNARALRLGTHAQLLQFGERGANGLLARGGHGKQEETAATGSAKLAAPGSGGQSA